jgi:hypothetical protein
MVRNNSTRSGRPRPSAGVALVLLAAVAVSAVAAGSMIGFVALTKSLAWAVVAAVLVSWLLGFPDGYRGTR